MLKTIKIDGIEQGETQYGKKITLLSGKEKYIFYDTKKDGGFTKAYDQFKRYRFAIGDSVSCEVDEEQKSFTDPKTQKPVSYTQRLIKYFQVVDDVPVVETPKTNPSSTYDGPTNGIVGTQINVSTEVYLRQIDTKLDGLRAYMEQKFGELIPTEKLPF